MNNTIQLKLNGIQYSIEFETESVTHSSSNNVVEIVIITTCKDKLKIRAHKNNVEIIKPEEPK